MRRARTLIVGGGPAGSAAAITLGRAGTRPELFERAPGDRDVVCGGFLGWDALTGLRNLGVDAFALGARPINRLRLVAADQSVETTLPAQAAGLSRRRLDSALLGLAGQVGTEVRHGRAVRSLVGGRTIRLDDGEEVIAEALFLATGKHELRGIGRSLAGRRQAPAAGLRAAVAARSDLERVLAGVIELHLFDDGYAGLLLQEDGSANFCLSISRARLAAAGKPRNLMAELIAESPRLGDRLGAIPHQWEAVAGVPYGWHARGTTEGLFRIGDQAAVIASLAGDGIAIALASGVAAAEAYLSGGPDDAAVYQQRFSGKVRRAILIGEWVRAAARRRASRRLMMALLQMAPGLARAGARLTRVG